LNKKLLLKIENKKGNHPQALHPQEAMSLSILNKLKHISTGSISNYYIYLYLI